MKLSQERVSHLAGLLVEKLTAARLVNAVGDKKALMASIERVISEELKVEDRINAEAKELVRKYQAEIDRGQMNEHQLFQMIKKQLVKQKGAIL